MDLSTGADIDLIRQWKIGNDNDVLSCNRPKIRYISPKFEIFVSEYDNISSDIIGIAA